jgi:hypothetical protein
MKKWETPVLSVMRRSTSAEKVLVICKHINNPVLQPQIYYGAYCSKAYLTVCTTCQAVNLS